MYSGNGTRPYSSFAPFFRLQRAQSSRTFSIVEPPPLDQGQVVVIVKVEVRFALDAATPIAFEHGFFTGHEMCRLDLRTCSGECAGVRRETGLARRRGQPVFLGHA